jgi:hypothetical protein
VFLFFVQAIFLFGEESKNGHAEKIAPLINDTTFVVTHIDLERLDIDKFFQKNFSDIDKIIKVFGFDPTSEKRITNEFSRLLENMKTKYKLQFDSLKSSVDARDFYFLVYIGAFDKLKNTVKFSFTFAVPTAQHSKPNRDGAYFNFIIDWLQADSDTSFNWAVGRHGEFDVMVIDFDWALPSVSSSDQAAIAVPEDEEVSPNDELIDKEELAAREKNWISKFFSNKNENNIKLIKESIRKHKENAPFRIVCINTTNFFVLCDQILSLPIKQEIDTPLQTQARKFVGNTKNLLTTYKKTKWMSIVLNPDSMMFESIVQMQSESDAKQLLELLFELYDQYCDFISEQFANTIKPSGKSKFSPLASEVLKGIYYINFPVQNGDKLELMQRDDGMHKLMCVEYCIIGYVMLIIWGN